MDESRQEWVILVFGRSAQQLSKRFITTQEYVNKLLDLFASSDRLYPEIVPTLCEMIDDTARCEFIAALRATTVPDFRYHTFEIGGSRGLTEEERQFQQVRNAKRVQAWANEMLQHLDSK